MERDVGVVPGRPGHGRQRKPGKRSQRMVAITETGKYQIEPDYVRAQIAECPQETPVVTQAVLLPATLHVKLGQLRLFPAETVGYHAQADHRVSLQFASHVKSIFVEYAFAGRKTTDEANFHGALDT